MLEKNKANLSKGAFDCHMHIYGLRDRFPTLKTNGLRNPANLDHYLALLEELNLSSIVYVQSSHYHRYNSCMLDAMASVPAKARRVVVVGV